MSGPGVTPLLKDKAAYEEFIGLADHRGAIVPLEMKLSNPATNSTLVDGLPIEYLIKLKQFDGETLKKKLLELGHDGVIFKSTMHGKPLNEHVSFDPKNTQFFFEKK